MRREVNCRAALLKQVWRLEGKLNICKPSKAKNVSERASNMVGRERTTVLKVAVNYVARVTILLVLYA